MQLVQAQAFVISIALASAKSERKLTDLSTQKALKTEKFSKLLRGQNKLENKRDVMRPNSQPPLSKLKPSWLEADGVRWVKQNIAQCLQNEVRTKITGYKLGLGLD